MTPEKEKFSAVYVGWNTFNNQITALVQAMPNRIDRTVFPGLAGGVQAQLLTGLRFLGLITGKDGKPTEALRALAVRDDGERKKQMAKTLNQSYPALFALDLSKTTEGELREEMSKSYGVAGATTDRALRFFLAAARYAEIDISSHVKVGSTNGTTTTRRRRAPKRPHDLPLMKAATGSGESQTVRLVSGGTLTLSATTSFMLLSPTDRAFVFELIDKLNEYMSAHPAPEAPPDTPEAPSVPEAQDEEAAKIE